MYEAFFGFREKPFNLTPDPRFLYLSPNHTEAFAHLEFGLKQRGGFVVVTGEVGTGKTTLCRYFLERLDEDTVSAFILYPALSAKELLESICDDLGIRTSGATSKQLVDALHSFLLDSRAAGKNIVVVIDEAQNLSPDVLEQIRLISNLETSTEKLIQLVLIGQSELTAMLGHESLRQLAQRVTARYHLSPLSRAETGEYVRHRIEIAGGTGKVTFTARALREVHRFSNGIPRLINLVCDRALLAGFVLTCREIDARLVKRAVNELDGIRPRSRAWYQSWMFRGTLAGATALVAGLGLWPVIEPRLDRFRGTVLEASETAPETPVVEAISHDDPGTVRAAAAFTSPELSEGALESRLRTMSHDLSRRDAAAALLQLWGANVTERLSVLLPSQSLSSLATQYGLEQTPLTAHFEQLRRLNLPVLLELHDSSRPDSCYAALLSLDEEKAIISFSPGEQYQISTAVLDRFWMRRAVVFWKDFEVLPPGVENKRARDWLQGHLTELGFLAESEADDREALRRALAAFQDSTDLVADGMVGPHTRMALYSLSGQYPVPRLVSP